MSSHFQKFMNFFKSRYSETEKELIMGEMIYKELFFSNISSEKYLYSHVTKLFIHYGFLAMPSKARFIIYLDKIRSFTGVAAID